jgi:hypothetical protein
MPIDRPLLEEVLGTPKSKIVDFLLQRAKWRGTKWADQQFCTADELSKATQIHRVKIFQYLSELKDEKVVSKTGNRPTKYRVCDTTLLPEQLVLIKSNSVATKKKKLDDELSLFKKRIDEVTSEASVATHLETRSAQHLANREEVYAALEESLRLVPKGGRVLCQTPSLTHWTLSEQERSKSKQVQDFLVTLQRKLESDEISSAIYLCPSSIMVKKSLAPTDNQRRIASLCEHLRLIKNLILLASDQILLGSMEIMIFGGKRIIYGLGDDKGYLEQAFMIESSAAATSGEEMFNRLFLETKHNSLSKYLDELRTAQRARKPKETKTLLELAASVEHAKSIRIDLASPEWSAAKDMLLANLDEEREYSCLRNQMVNMLQNVIS